ncbi:MAG: hypothetical protein PUH84_04360 [Firmicutes bacterium]|nr:hypothetical protein [Bacillota bacterium]MDY5336020.1 DUF6568 family protein [Bacilli bacterium]
MKKEKEISFKNYIILAVILIFTILLVVYLFNWQSIYQKNKLQEPILDKYLMVINYNELDDYLVENKEAIVYVSVLNDEKIRMFENKFKNLIIKNDLNNKVLYLNLTNESVEINKKYLSNLSEVPTLIIFDEGKVVESYSIKDNNYDIKAFEKFLKKEEIIND